MVCCRKVIGDYQRNGLQGVQPGEQRADNGENPQPNPISEKVGNRVPGRLKLSVDSDFRNIWEPAVSIMLIKS
jgi:hypothetical protein